MAFIDAWAQAIASAEGFGAPGARPTRNHNPGDLKLAGQAGAVGADAAGFAIFPDDATGFQALYNQLNKYVREFPGYSLLQITAHYLGMGSTATVNKEGNAFAYANSVASALGTSTDTTIGQLAADSQPAAPSQDQVATDVPPDDGGGFTPSGGEMIAILAVGGLFLFFLLRG